MNSPSRPNEDNAGGRLAFSGTAASMVSAKKVLPMNRPSTSCVPVLRMKVRSTGGPSCVAAIESGTSMMEKIWGLVATDAAITKPRYSALQRGTDGQLTFCVDSGEALFLVVMATPSAMQQIAWDQAYSSIYRYPYLVELANAWPEGFQGGKHAACPPGTARVANG